MKNQVQLITYVDRLAAGGLKELTDLLVGPRAVLRDLFGGVHLLPFFHPIDGADAGFDPIDHTRVDPRLGDWRDVKALASHVEVMGDVIVNHVSSSSPQFVDWSARGSASPWAGLFLTLDAVFPNGATEREWLKVYRPRPGLPLTCATLANGERKILWTTFTPQQIDIDVMHPQGQTYLDGILTTFAANGIRMIRLDAVGYAIKKAGTSCFMLPQTMTFMTQLADRAHDLGIEVLVEVHAHHHRQIQLSKHVDWVYDFALPPLVLYALIFGDATPLKHWIGVRPHNALTVLDTHDGIGIIDIGADTNDLDHAPGLIEPAQLDRLVEAIHANSAGQSREATGAAASNLDLYQVNCTFYDALARDDRAYLMARAIQFFLPGVPQVYYVGLLAGQNDMALLQRTGVGRDINRHHFSRAEIDAATREPVVQDLFDLIRLRNAHPAFAGSFESTSPTRSSLRLQWRLGQTWIALEVDTAVKRMRVTGDQGAGEQVYAWRCLGQEKGARSASAAGV